MAAIFIIQVLVAVVHSVIRFYKSKNQVIHINLAAVQEGPFQLNIQAYNDDIVTLKEFSVLSLILIAGITFRVLMFNPNIQTLSQNVVKTVTILVFCRRLLLSLAFLFIALTFYMRNQSLRKFAWKFSCCKCNEL